MVTGRLASVTDALSVLEEDGWVFSQSGPWDSGGFVRAAVVRGFELGEEQLEVLYRAGLLAPFVVVHDEAVRPPMPPPAFPMSHGWSLVRHSLAQALLEGRVSDPVVDPLPRDWSFGASRRVGRHHRWWNGLLYSPWQVLELASLRGYFTKRGKPIVDAWANLAVDPCTTALGARDRQTTLVLTSIEPRYLPELHEGFVRLSNTDFEDWEQYRSSFRAADLAHRLGTSEQAVTALAERLLSEARIIDPLGRWYRVVRHGSPRAMDDLRGEARLALDMRRGAELLLLFAHDLGAPAVELGGRRRGWHPFDDRLSRHGESLDEALIEAGVSPHPRVLLVLEGETEGYLAKRVLDHLHLPLLDDEMRIVIMRGVGQRERVLKLAAESATPAILEATPEFYRLRRPACRVIVATDPEGKMAQPAKFKADLAREILKGLGEQGVTDADPEEIAALINVNTWEAAFEFAHFTDEEIASALESLPDRALPRDVGHGDAVAFVASVRRRDVSLTKNNKKLSKTRLAEALWPSLANKIDEAVNGDAPVPPLAGVVCDAHSIAADARSKNYVIGRRTAGESGARGTGHDEEGISGG